MLDRRRSSYRRALSGGVTLAITSMLVVGLIELVYVLLVGGPSFGGLGRGVLFGVTVVAVPIGFGVVIGLVEGGVVNSLALLAEKVAKQRLAQPRWTARLYTIFSLPFVAIFVHEMVSGRRAREMSSRHMIAAGMALVLVVGVYLFTRVVVGCRDRFRIRRWEKKQAAWLMVLLAVVTIGLYVLDQRFYSRLYPAMHIALAVATIIGAQLMLAAFNAGWRASSKRLGRLFEPGVTLFLVVISVAAGAWGLSRVARSAPLRYVVLQHTVVQGKLVKLSSRLGLLPKRAAKAVKVAQASVRKATSRLGPKRQQANIVFVSVDALRADHLGVYGYRRPTSPSIDAWAKSAVVFERGYCAVPHTSFSVCAMLTGRHMSSFNDQGECTLAAALRRDLYKTAGFFPPAVFYIDGERFRTFQRSKYDFEYVKFEFLAAERRVDQILAFLREDRGDRPFFVWAHFFEPHEPYEKRAAFDFGRRAVDRYDGEVAYVDKAFGRLVREVKKKYPNTIFALTADHGEAFGEHGSHYHGNTLYEEQIRVPLIISVPGVPPRRVPAAAQTVDIAPTLLSLVGAKFEIEATGRDLGPWLAGEEGDRLPPAFCELHQKRALIGRRYKLIYDTDWEFSELYDLENDSRELDNAAAAQPDRVATLQAQLHERVATLERSGARVASVASELLEQGRRGDRAAVPGLVALAREGTTEQRREALRFLLQIRARAAREAFIEGTKHKDPGVSITATVGAAMWGHRASYARLNKVLARDDLPPKLQRDGSIIRAENGDRRALAPLVKMLRASKQTYESLALIKALGALGDARAVPTLVEQLERVRTRRFAVQALGNIRAEAAIPDLGHVVLEEGFVSLRVAAARALGAIGDSSAIPILKEVIARDLEAPVVDSALAALAALDGLPSEGGPRGIALVWKCDAESCVGSASFDCAERAGYDLLIVAAHRGSVAELYCGKEKLGVLNTTRMHTGQFGAEFHPDGMVAPVKGKGPLTVKVRASDDKPIYLGYRARPKRPIANDEG